VALRGACYGYSLIRRTTISRRLAGLTSAAFTAQLDAGWWESGEVIPLDITTQSDGDGLVRLLVAGEIDTDTAGQLVQAVEQAFVDDPRGVTVDMTGVTFLDSSGIRAVLTARRLAGEHGAALRVAGVHGNVLEVLTVAGLLGILDADSSNQLPPEGWQRLG
jgi:anti-sigma B factor antagonist